MEIIKASGRKEKFNTEKIRYSLERIGADLKTTEEVISGIEENAYDGMKSDSILKDVMGLLKKKDPTLAAKYNLKKAIMSLGPSGYPFERYLAGLLEENGYRTEVGQSVRGHCVDHEVDVIAEKDGEFFMVECKYHNTAGARCDVKVALYIYARFLDLKEAEGGTGAIGRRLSRAVLATNTKCTLEAIKFAECRNMKIISWRYPKKQNLEELIEKNGLYPVTILPSLTEEHKGIFLRNNIVSARDLIKMNLGDLSRKTGIAVNHLEFLQKEAKQISE